jgi:hypothetical protein
MRKHENPEVFPVKKPLEVPGRGEVEIVPGFFLQYREAFMPEVYFKKRSDSSRGEVELGVPVRLKGLCDRLVEGEPA